MAPDSCTPERTYLAIDLKSFYASVECADRGLDPFATDLVVADPTRSPNTICLAITPSLKAKGVRNRCRIREIPQGIPYITAMPRMHRYMEVSAQVYAIYLRYVSSQDAWPYSVDEAFLDVTSYQALYGLDVRALARRVITAVREETGVSATAGIGPNMFLCKVALDLMAKHAADGIGQLDEKTFRRNVWFHHPITDIWGIGPGIARRLAQADVHDLAGICATDPTWLRGEFGRNAEWLIDHAWGLEPVTMADIKNYRSDRSSLSRGQVLPRPYLFGEARIVLREMIEELCMDMFSKNLQAKTFTWWIGYDYKSLEKYPSYAGPLSMDFYGRLHPRHSNGTVRLPQPTNAAAGVSPAILTRFDSVCDRRLLFRRLSVCAADTAFNDGIFQLDMFTDRQEEWRQQRMQGAMLQVRQKYGANALFRGMDLLKGATALERNEQIGGHRK